MFFIKDIIKNKFLYILALPGFTFLIIFAYVPLFGYLIAFEDFKLAGGIFGSRFVGLDNFRFFFGGHEWLKVTFNTVFLNGLFIVFGLGTSIILALLLNEIRNLLFKKISQSIVFLPYFISWLVVSFMTYSALNSTDGIVNKVLNYIGLESVQWYLRPEVWPALLTIIYVWKFSGYYSIIFLSAITGISAEYYESAKIDGATKIQQITSITIPLIRPTLIILILLGLGRIFYGDFGMIYGIVGDSGMLYSTTDVIDTYTFRSLRKLGNFSMSSAVTLYQSVMGLITIVFFNWISKRIDSYSSIF